MIIVVSGVCGTGKSTIGALLAKALGIDFYDADDFHPKENIDKMRSGNPLDHSDRHLWLLTLAEKLEHWSQGEGAVLACSALQEAYRKKLASKCTEPINWVVLYGSEKLLAERLSNRKGHFLGANLLRSQLDLLEMPEYGIHLDVEATPAVLVDTLLARLRKNELLEKSGIGDGDDDKKTSV